MHQGSFQIVEKLGQKLEPWMKLKTIPHYFKIPLTERYLVRADRIVQNPKKATLGTFDETRYGGINRTTFHNGYPI